MRLLFIFVIALLAPVQESRVETKNPKEVTSPPLREFEPPKPMRIQLSNGIILYALEDHELPVVRMQIRIKGGAIHDPSDKVGLSAVTAEVLRTGGTKTMSGDQIDEKLESLGASIEFLSSDDSISGNLFALKNDFDAVLNIFKDIIIHPKFSEEKIEQAKVMQKSAIARRNDDPFSIAFRKMGEIIYGASHPMGRSAENETIDAITRDDLITLHNKIFAPNNLLIGITGDFKTSELSAKLQKTFGGWEQKDIRLPKITDPKISDQVAVYYVEKDDITQSAISIGHLGVRRDEAEYFNLALADSILGGFSGRLFKNVRSDKGLAYTVRASEGAGWVHPGIFRLFCSTKAETTHQAISALLEELEKITSEPVTDDELSLAKDTTLNSFVFEFESKAQIVSRHMSYEFYGYPHDFNLKYQTAVQNATKEDILRAVKKHFQPSRLAILVVGNKANFEKPLDSFGKVTELQLEKPRQDVAIQTSPESIKKGQEILSKAISKIGSPDTLKQIRTMIMAMSMTTDTQMGKMEMEGEFTLEFPDRIRIDIETPMGKVVQVLNKNDAWQSAMGNTSPLPKSQAGDLKQSIDGNFLYMLKKLCDNDTIPVQYAGQEEVNGTKADVIQITEGPSAGTKLYVDPQTNFIVKMIQTGGSGPEDRTVLLAQHKKMEGFTVPTKYIWKSQAGSMEVLLKSIKINPSIEPAVFEQPTELSK